MVIIYILAGIGVLALIYLLLFIVMCIGGTSRGRSRGGSRSRGFDLLRDKFGNWHEID